MEKGIIFLIIIIIIIGLILGRFIFKSNLCIYEKINSLIDLGVFIAATISAIIVVYSYKQTNLAFILSKKPSLLVQVIQDKENPQMTHIVYRNITRNTFEDLTFDIEVFTSSQKIDLSDIFRRKNMNMPGLDRRDMNFNILKELNKRGFDLSHEYYQGNEVGLRISYKFTFLNKKENVLAQEYRWNNEAKGWNIY